MKKRDKNNDRQKTEKRISYAPLKFKTTSFALTKQKRSIERLLTQFIRAKYLRDWRKVSDREAKIKEVISLLLVCASYDKRKKNFVLNFLIEQ